MLAKPNQNGAVIWRGPSELDGAPIMVIVTGLVTDSDNGKTGAMLQTWIMREDIAPGDALRSGADSSVCGSCPHRPILGGACYVDVHKAPRTIWYCAVRGAGYREVTDAAGRASIGAGRIVRLGAYGDPAAVPAHVWQELTADAAGHTGYSHQWRTAPAGIRALCMASVDSESEREEARAMGWRTFRVRSAADAALGARESVCPASDEAGHLINCATCQACDGAGSGRRGSIVIVVHGSKAKRFKEA